jgi:hypothetical protein
LTLLTWLVGGLYVVGLLSLWLLVGIAKYMVRIDQ